MRRLIHLIWALSSREIKGRYRRSLLGPAWAVLQPLLYLVAFSFLSGVLKISSEGMPYVIFTYSALVPWTFFSNAITRCGSSVTANRAIIKKIAVAREVFPVAGIVTALLDFGIASAILVGMMFWFGVDVGWTLLWVLPLVLMTALLALGLGLGAAALGAYRDDVLFGLPFLMQFWLLATPVMYPISQVPAGWRSLYTLNPMVGLIEAFRSVLVKGFGPELELLGISLVGIAIVWLLAWPLFRYMSRYFADSI